jgi:TetR/AcrR family transcriptional regulator, transcriptional repressor for nem operon
MTARSCQAQPDRAAASTRSPATVNWNARSRVCYVALVARTKAFDPDAALDRAMDVFWARGFDGTSAENLVEALGINRSSLYGTFGSKRELYLKALSRYAAVGGERVRAAVAGEGSVRDRLRRGLLAIAEDDLGRGASRGCFAINAGSELAGDDAEVRRLVRAAFDEVRDVLLAELRRGAAAGEIAADRDLDALASTLMTALQGIRVVAKSTRSRRTVEQSVDTLLALL